jgi:hypothetical protein
MSRQVSYSTVQNINWNITRNDDGTYPQSEAVFAVQMDVREELRKLNRLLSCHNFIRIPRILDGIKDNTKPLRCGKHPSYRGVSKPIARCRTCRLVHRIRHSI